MDGILLFLVAVSLGILWGLWKRVEKLEDRVQTLIARATLAAIDSGTHRVVPVEYPGHAGERQIWERMLRYLDEQKGEGR